MNKLENSFLMAALDSQEIRKLGSGEVNKTFLYKSVVVHLTPVIDILDEHVAKVLNRWSYPKKPEKLQELQTALQKLPDIKVPEVYQTGKITYRSRETPYWIEDFVVGKTLLRETFEGVHPQTYERILEWLSSFHDNHQLNGSLRDYYHQRLTSLKKLLEIDGGIKTLFSAERVENLRKLINKAQTEVDMCVGKDEVVTTIHGDLRGENVLIEGDTIGIIDFEQGVNGGDWFTDIQKLLMLGNNSMPDSNKPFKYRPPLNITTKQKLFASYLSNRRHEGLAIGAMDELFNPTTDRFQLRQKLFSLDNSLSMAALRYYLGLANQTAGIGQIDINAILHRIEVMEGELK